MGGQGSYRSKQAGVCNVIFKTAAMQLLTYCQDGPSLKGQSVRTTFHYHQITNLPSKYSSPFIIAHH